MRCIEAPIKWYYQMWAMYFAGMTILSGIVDQSRRNRS